MVSWTCALNEWPVTLLSSWTAQKRQGGQGVTTHDEEHKNGTIRRIDEPPKAPSRAATLWSGRRLGVWRGWGWGSGSPLPTAPACVRLSISQVPRPLWQSNPRRIGSPDGPYADLCHTAAYPKVTWTSSGNGGAVPRPAAAQATSPPPLTAPHQPPWRAH